MVLLNELVEPKGRIIINTELYLKIYDEGDLEWISNFRKNDFVILDEEGLIKYRNCVALEKVVKSERKMETYLSNVNRIGIIESVKKERTTRGKGYIRGFRIEINIRFEDGKKVQVCDTELIRKID